MRYRVSRRLCALALATTIGCLALQLTVAQPAGAEAFCPQIIAGVGVGQNDFLKRFVETYVRCVPSQPWQLTVGWRYTERVQQALPYGMVSYSPRAPTGWDLSIIASYRERLGDYEGHRLPELIARRSWDGPGWVPSLELSVGAISIIEPAVSTERFGITARLRPPVVHLSPSAELRGNLRGGLYAYGSGQSHSYWVADLTAAKRLPRGGEIGLTYTRQDGTGSSPLAYDFTGFDQYVTARLGWPVSGSLNGSASVSFGLSTPVVTVREYVLSISHARGWSVGATLRMSDSRVLVTLSLPN